MYKVSRVNSKGEFQLLRLRLILFTHVNFTRIERKNFAVLEIHPWEGTHFILKLFLNKRR